MFEKLNIFKMSQAMATHAGRQQAAAALNVANADTPGFKAHALPSFAEYLRVSGMVALRATRPGHWDLDPGPTIPDRSARLEASPNGNNVGLETEMLRAADAKRDHDRALAVYKSGLIVLRTSLGR
ncbi:MAG: FlgB family protein [Sulfitobacter sp.]